ncbi:MAG: TIGR02221 family CRISPR-associated protein [Alphaproteobacteria bacterium]|nr:TIGR02221 family CRISPR-associated protein [Alphaproteobacteria bacterium]
MSFLGLGAPRREGKEIVDYAYSPCEFELGGERVETRYVQAAVVELQRRRGMEFDRILLAMTPTSRKWHWELEGRLSSELSAATLERVRPLEISEDLRVDAQWANFGKLLSEVPHGAHLHVDLTHGYRAIPILFSVAIELLTQVKGVTLEGAYYGAFEPGKPGPFPIVELARFFEVNRWAEAVRAVTEDANPSKLAALAHGDASSLEMSGLSSEELVDALSHLAAVIKNANAVQAAAACDRALRAIAAARETTMESPVSGPLLDLLAEKFGSLAHAGAELRLTRPWYDTQLMLAQVMIEHGLVMQGLTILQELMVSVCEELCARELTDPNSPGRVAYLATKPWTKLAKKYAGRRKIGAALLARLRLGPATWNPGIDAFDPDGVLTGPTVDAVVERWFARRVDGETQRLDFLSELGNLRNAFNHAWIERKQEHHTETSTRAIALQHQVEDLVRGLIAEGAIGRGDPALT